MTLFPQDRPPIAWSLWERVRACGSASVFLTAFMLGVDLLVADVAGGRAFSRLTPGGSIPLWPWVLTAAITIPAAGIVAGLAIPLFRYRHGGVAAGALVGLVLVCGSLMIRGLGTWDLSTVEGWQRVAAVLTVIGMHAWAGSAACDFVLGRADAESGIGPPVT